MTNSPDNPSLPALLEGVVDGIRERTVHGWARLDDGGSGHADIEVHDGDVLLGQGEANLYRADLAAAGKRDGHCAFAIVLDQLPAPGTELRVIARCGERVQELVGSPLKTGLTVPAADILPLPIGNARLQG